MVSPLGQFVGHIRHICRACRSVCLVPETAKVDTNQGYRCESCDAAQYERHDFDASVTKPESSPPLSDAQQKADGEQLPSDDESMVTKDDNPETPRENLSAQESQQAEVIAEEVVREDHDERGVA